jgi:hypothetical protein
MSENGATKVRLPIQCPACQQSFSSTLPELEISNALFTSMVTASHEKLARCICGQHFVLLIVGAQASWQAAPVGEDVVQKAGGSKLIVPSLKLM